MLHAMPVVQLVVILHIVILVKLDILMLLTPIFGHVLAALPDAFLALLLVHVLHALHDIDSLPQLVLLVQLIVFNARTRPVRIAKKVMG